MSRTPPRTAGTIDRAMTKTSLARVALRATLEFAVPGTARS